MDLFDQVLHAIEGEEIHRSSVFNFETRETRIIEQRTFGHERWINRAKLGRIDAINFLAIILFVVEGDDFIAVRDSHQCKDSRRRIVEHWSGELRAAAESGEIKARDTASWIPLRAIPDSWEWMITDDDAEKFLQSRGVGFTCASILNHLSEQCKPNPSVMDDKEKYDPCIKEEKECWQDSARAIADAFFDQDTVSGCRDTLKSYAVRTMEEMQKRKIHGPRGRIDNPGYVQREALQGKQWWQNKPK